MRQTKIVSVLLAVSILLSLSVCNQLEAGQLAGWASCLSVLVILAGDGVWRWISYEDNRFKLIAEAQAATTAAERSAESASAARLESAEKDKALQAARDEIQSRVDEKMAKAYKQIMELEDTIRKMDLVGQFLVLAWQWGAAREWDNLGTWTPPQVAGVTMDTAYWWSRVKEKAKELWPDKNWKKEDLFACAYQASSVTDLDRWNRLITSDFGFTLPIKGLKKKTTKATAAIT